MEQDVNVVQKVAKDIMRHIWGFTEDRIYHIQKLKRHRAKGFHTMRWHRAPFQLL